MNDADLWELLTKSGIRPDSATAIVRSHRGMGDADLWERLTQNGASPDVATSIVQSRGGSGAAPSAPAPNTDLSLRNIGRSFTQGATFGFGDELGLTDKANEAAFKQAHPIADLLAKMGGGMIAPVAAVAAAPEALGGLAGAVGLGAATGALTGAGEAENGQRLKGAATGGLLGGAAGGLGYGASKVAGKAFGSLLDYIRPERTVIREAATQLPKGAGATIARQEALAPGSAALADLSPEMTAMARGVGADAPTGVAARTEAASRLAALKQARDALGPRFDALQRDLPIDKELQAILAKANERVAGPSTNFLSLQQIRTSLLESAKSARRASDKKAYGDAARALTGWLEDKVPGVDQLNSDYRFLSQRIKDATGLLKEVSTSSKNYAAARTYGVDAGSIGGSLPQGSRGMVQVILDALRPDRGDRAIAVRDLLLTPGDATTTALARIEAARAAMQASPSRAAAGLRAGLLTLVPQRLPGLLTPNSP